MIAPWVIAHRGVCRTAAANSLEAFEAACALGADMVELDVRRTLDGHYVVYHDAAVGGRETELLTFAELRELASRRPLRRRHGRLEGGPPPLLEETVALLARSSTGLDLELKTPGDEREILRIVLDHLPPDRVIVTSFHDHAVAAAKRAAARVRTGLLLEPMATTVARVSDRRLLTRARRCTADLILPYHGNAVRRLLVHASAAGVGVIPWTVNRPHRLMQLLAAPGIVGLVTDIPDIALQLRDGHGHGAIRAATPQ